MGQCVNDLYVTAAFLWWLPDEADFSLGFNQTPSIVAPAGVSGSILRFRNSWDPGFRVGLGWQSHTPEGWDVYVDWTWYKNKTSQNATVATPAGVGAGIVPYWGASVFNSAPGLFGNMNASWRLLYNMIDLELGREFYVSCGLSLRPFMSVEGGWIHRKWSVSYSNLLSTSAVTLDGDPQSYSSKSNYWGVGPRAGLNGNWHLGAGFKFFGNLSGSLLSGRVSKNAATFSNTGVLAPVLGSNTFSDGKIFRIVPHLQAIVGGGWEFCFSCEQYRFAFTAGWEVNEFWNVPMALFPDTTVIGSGTGITNRENRSHNIGMSGLTAEVRFDF